MAQNQLTDLTMLANTTFDSVISQIRSSCLNFSMQLTPFSAVISLRKSFMMDKSGSVVLPFTRENMVKVEVENNKHENIEVDIIKDLQSKVIECEKIISGLKTELEQARDTTVRLNEELCYTKRKFENEKNLILKDHLSDMMTWKKDMCEISKKHSDLQIKFELVSTDFQLEEPESVTVCSADKICGICANQTLHFQPHYVVKQTMNISNVECNTKAHTDSLAFVAHWFIPPDLLPNDCSSLVTMRSHFVTQHDVESNEVVAKSKMTLFEKHQREYEETCRQS